MKNVKKVRPILQMEKTECGAACLAMILDHYRKEVTLEELRRECGVSRNGVNAKNIVKAARFYNLNTRAFRAEIEDLERLAMPLIIHWNMNHFTVLCGFGKNGAVLADPVYGLRTVPMDEFSKSFTGIAIELTPGEGFKPDASHKKRGGYAASCVRPFWKYAGYFALVELCALTGSVDNADEIEEINDTDYIVSGEMVDTEEEMEDFRENASIAAEYVQEMFGIKSDG